MEIAVPETNLQLERKNVWSFYKTIDDFCLRDKINIHLGRLPR